MSRGPRCKYCGARMRPSSLQQIEQGAHFCYSCRITNEPNRTMTEAIDESFQALTERIESIEKMLTEMIRMKKL